MSVELLEAKPDDFENIFPLFQKYLSRETPKEKIKRFFSNYWKSDEDYCGYMLKDNYKVVGYLGYFFYNRIITNETHKFCNIQGWVVEKDYRIEHKMKVMEPVLDMKDYTIIGLNPTKAAYINEKKLGFKNLEDSYFIIPAIGSVKGFIDSKIKVFNKSEDLIQILDGTEKKVMSDHLRFSKLKYAAIAIDGILIFIVYTIRQKKKLPFAEIHYISNLDLFLAEFQPLRSLVSLRLKVFGFFIDKRFLIGKVFPFMYEYKYPIPNIYISDRLKPHQIDLLYSEKFVLYG